MFFEDKIFMPHDFISLATSTTSILLWILGKSISNPKRAHKQNDAKAHGLKSMAYYLIKAHGLTSWHIISFSAYDPSS